MDNITHSLIGLGAGQLLQRSLPPEADPAHQGLRRRLLLFACWAASNAPDLDLALKPLLPNPLGYLLHHRGHTHTVLFALPQALLLWALIWLLWPAARALLRRSAPARAGLAAALAAGLGLHLLLDFLNSYGLHPFYPFDAGWYYGDAVFIVEPLFWVAFGVPLALALRRPGARVLALLALGGALLYFTLHGFLAWGALAALLCAGAVAGVLQRRDGTHGRRALLFAGALSLAFVALQGGMSGLGKARVRAALHGIDPAARVLDVALTAFPADPLCWVFVTVESNEGADSYRLRRGLLNLAPAWLPAACPGALSGAPAPSAPLTLQAEHRGRLSALRQFRQENCVADAWLRFARDPVIGARTAGDLRFGADDGRNFTTLALAPPGPGACPRGVPGWAYPRADLLGAPAGQ